jgi:hypothetical protein
VPATIAPYLSLCQTKSLEYALETPVNRTFNVFAESDRYDLKMCLSRDVVVLDDFTVDFSRLSAWGVELPVLFRAVSPARACFVGARELGHPGLRTVFLEGTSLWTRSQSIRFVDSAPAKGALWYYARLCDRRPEPTDIEFDLHKSCRRVDESRVASKLRFIVGTLSPQAGEPEIAQFGTVQIWVSTQGQVDLAKTLLKGVNCVELNIGIKK